MHTYWFLDGLNPWRQSTNTIGTGYESDSGQSETSFEKKNGSTALHQCTGGVVHDGCTSGLLVVTANNASKTGFSFLLWYKRCPSH
jgi:hypothetical protein